MKINKQAEELNSALKESAKRVYALLSEYGKHSFFPKQGILAQTAEAKETKINATIGQAFEDDKSPMVLKAFSEQVNLPKSSFLYSPSYGQRELREIWKKEILKKNPSIKTNISLPVVTNALTHGLYLVNKLFVNKGEEIIIPEPFWENYGLVFDNAKISLFDLFKENKFNIEGLKEKLNGTWNKKIVLLNFPNNPTGYTPTEQEFSKIIDSIKSSAEKGRKIVAVCDDSYFGLVYEGGISKESVFSKVCNLHENVLGIKLDGITKEAYAWGSRIGFITYGFKGIDEKTASVLEDKTAGAVRATISNACTHSQILAINGLKSEAFSNQKAEKYKELKKRYEIVKEVLTKNKKYMDFFHAMPFNSGYFMCIKLKNRDANEVRKQLIREFSTGVISIDNFLRIAYSSVSKEEIPRLFENIYRACKKSN